MRINEILRALREDNDYTQNEIAKKLGISQQYYSKYEKGDYEIPIRHLISLSKIYAVSLDYIAGLSTSKIPNEKLVDAYTKQNAPLAHLLNSAYTLDATNQQRLVEYLDLLLLKEKYIGSTNH